jgi:hypothetical protein
MLVNQSVDDDQTAIDAALFTTIQAVASIQIVGGLVSTVNRQEQATQRCA